jgi:hypothetical protein
LFKRATHKGRVDHAGGLKPLRVDLLPLYIVAMAGGLGRLQALEEGARRQEHASTETASAYRVSFQVWNGVVDHGYVRMCTCVVFLWPTRRTRLASVLMRALAVSHTARWRPDVHLACIALKAGVMVSVGSLRLDDEFDK